MLLLIALPLAILAAGIVAALCGRRYNRGLTLGCSIILAVVVFAALAFRTPGLLR